jgi:arabinogalactan oligomer/maltooligosaccharide transport system permease protein
MSERKTPYPYLLVLPSVIILLIFTGFPLIYGMGLSFTNMNLATFKSPHYNGLTNYIRIFSSPDLYVVTLRTIIWTIINVTFHVSIGLFLALMLNRRLPGKNLIRVLLMIPWAVPEYISALAWRGMFQSQFGAVNLILGSLGIQGPSWLTEPTWTLTACIITNIWLGVPFMMLISLSGLTSIPVELYEAGDIDGVNWWQKLRKITLPLLKPVLLPATILGTVWTFNKVTIIIIMTNGTSNEKTHILVTKVFRDAFSFFNYGKAAAFSVIIFLMLALFASSFIKAMKGDKGVYD